MMRNPIATQGECQPKSVTGDKRIITRWGVITISNMNYHQAITSIPLKFENGEKLLSLPSRQHNRENCTLTPKPY